MVPVIVKPLTDAEALEAQLVENLQREGEHPLVEAEGYEELMALKKMDVNAGGRHDRHGPHLRL
jgi:ParB-like chromosome segregation protein Spo0J